MTDQIKQEAEQYAESIYPGNSSQDKYKSAIAGFIKGAEWMQANDPEKERMREALRQAYNLCGGNILYATMVEDKEMEARWRELWVIINPLAAALTNSPA